MLIGQVGQHVNGFMLTVKALTPKSVDTSYL